MALKAARVSEVRVLDHRQAVPEIRNAALLSSPTIISGGEENGKGEGRRRPSMEIWDDNNNDNGKEEKKKKRKRKFVVMGHRGNGMNMLELCDDRRMRATRENTIRSFRRAGRLRRLDFVEFDVQVTKDGFPVIFHDVFLYTKEQGEIVENRITDLNLDEFLSYGPQRNAQNKQVGKPIYRKTKCGRIFEWAVEDDDCLCTLKDVFESINNDSLGFNIELKFDNNRVYSEEELVRAIQVIMQVVFEHAKERMIMFSTFHPDAALLIPMLQTTYPVFFLSNGGNEIHSDARRNSLEEAVKICLAGGLQGIVSEVKAILRDPGAIAKIKHSKLSLITYGQLNNVGEVVSMQLKMGVEGVIADVVEEIIEVVSKIEGSDSRENGDYLSAEKAILAPKIDHCSEEEICWLLRLVPGLMRQC